MSRLILGSFQQRRPSLHCSMNFLCCSPIFIIIQFPLRNSWLPGGLGGMSKKKRHFLGICPKWPDPPPPPPFGTSCLQKKFLCLFCIFGHKEHFWFSQKITFWVTFLHPVLGIGDPLASLLGKIPK